MFFGRRFAKFQQIDVPLTKYYGLNEKVNLLVDKGDSSLFLTIIYRNKHPIYTFKELPDEINELIYSFCGDFIEIRAKLYCTLRFPYESPVWEIVSVKNNLYNRGIITLEDYYKYIADCINKSNIAGKNWSATYGFEKEILRFFIRVNHFESVVSNI